MKSSSSPSSFSLFFFALPYFSSVFRTGKRKEVTTSNNQCVNTGVIRFAFKFVRGMNACFNSLAFAPPFDLAALFSMKNVEAHGVVHQRAVESLTFPVTRSFGGARGPARGMPPSSNWCISEFIREGFDGELVKNCSGTGAAISERGTVASDERRLSSRKTEGGPSVSVACPETSCETF